VDRQDVFGLESLRRAKRGDSAAANEVAKALLRWAKCRPLPFRGLDPDDLAAIFSTRLCRNQFASLPELEGPRLEAFLQRVYLNLAVDAQRSLRRRSWLIDFQSLREEQEIEAERSTQPESVVLAREAFHLLAEAAQVLSTENRQLLFAAAVGTSHRDLAARFRLKPNTLSQRLWSARRQLRRALEKTEV
jgi:RNA polymerase sigma factor (sigma-70 family)